MLLSSGCQGAFYRGLETSGLRSPRPWLTQGSARQNQILAHR